MLIACFFLTCMLSILSTDLSHCPNIGSLLHAVTWMQFDLCHHSSVCVLFTTNLSFSCLVFTKSLPGRLLSQMHKKAKQKLAQSTLSVKPTSDLVSVCLFLAHLLTLHLSFCVISSLLCSACLSFWSRIMYRTYRM